MLLRGGEFGGCGRDERCFVLQYRGGAGDGFFGLFPLPLFHGFADRGDSFGFVAGVDTGRVDLVLVPRSSGQAFGVGEFALAVDEHAIDFGNRR